MQVYLDDNLIDAPSGALAEALAAGVRRAEAEGRIIVEIHADGQPVEEADLSEPPDRDPYAAELRMLSVEPRSFLQATLMDGAEALEDARQGQRRAGELLQQGKAAEAMSAIADAIGIWQMARRIVQDGAALLETDATGLLGRGDDDPDELLTTLAELLDDLKQAMGCEDWSAAADVLAYDLDEQIDRWRAALRACAETLHDPSPHS